jgi:hypothetical protein
VTPGLPLISVVDLSDTWLGFSLREDLIAGLTGAIRLFECQPEIAPTSPDVPQDGREDGQD